MTEDQTTEKLWRFKAFFFKSKLSRYRSSRSIEHYMDSAWTLRRSWAWGRWRGSRSISGFRGKKMGKIKRFSLLFLIYSISSVKLPKRHLRLANYWKIQICLDFVKFEVEGVIHSIRNFSKLKLFFNFVLNYLGGIVNKKIIW